MRGENKPQISFIPIKRVVNKISNGTTIDQVDKNTEFHVTRIESISDNMINLKKLGNVEYDQKLDKFKLNKGDILFSHINSLVKVGNVAIYTYDMPLYNGMNLLRIEPDKSINCMWLYYVLRSYDFNQKVKMVAKHAINQVSVSTTNLKQIEIPFVNRNIQESIAYFLDHKTIEIDDLIADKEKLIKLLEERRQAVITEAVTKGLEPNVKMKDSGVKWIGEIPEHWEVKRLKYLFEIKKRIENLENPHILSVTQKGIKVKDITKNEGQLAANYDKYQTVRAGDFVMNHMDLLTGFIDVSRFNGVTSPDYRVFRMRNEKFVRQYFLYYFQMSYYRKIFYKFGQGVSSFGRWRLPTDEFYNFCVPVPTIEEQIEVVKYISSHLADSENVIEQTKNTINKLKEYRQSLIYEAVTGKIDVREVMNETEQEEVSSS